MDANRLKSIPAFADLDEQQLNAVATYATEKSVGEGEELVREGDYAYDFIVIEEGEAVVTRDGAEVARLRAGDFFGEIGVLEKTLRTATVTAASPMRLVILSHWDLKNIKGLRDKVEAALEERRPAGLTD